MRKSIGWDHEEVCDRSNIKQKQMSSWKNDSCELLLRHLHVFGIMIQEKLAKTDFCTWNSCGKFVKRVNPSVFRGNIVVPAPKKDCLLSHFTHKQNKWIKKWNLMHETRFIGRMSVYSALLQRKFVLFLMEGCLLK